MHVTRRTILPLTLTFFVADRMHTRFLAGTVTGTDVVGGAVTAVVGVVVVAGTVVVVASAVVVVARADVVVVAAIVVVVEGGGA